MNFLTNKISSLSSRRMEWSAQRQQVIAENIANADTPGYRARDVVPFSDALGAAGKLQMQRTAPGHLGGGPSSGQFAIIADDTWSDTISGNNVILEEQMLKASETKGAHDLATTLYQKSMSMMSAAMRRE